MFFEPSRTQFDLNFRLFGVHVRVHPMHWVVSALLGSSALREGWQFLLIWILCVFVSVLLHELGHVLAMRAFGTDGHIVLYSFGGLAIPFDHIRKPWQRIIVSFAGPAIQLVLLAVVVGVWAALRWKEYPLNPLANELLWDLFVINLLWPIFNLLPIWPLDGGQITREVCSLVSPSGGVKASLVLSIITAGGLAAHSLAAANGLRVIPFLGGSWFSALFFASLAVGSIQGLIHLNQERRWLESHWQDEGDQWERWRR